MSWKLLTCSRKWFAHHVVADVVRDHVSGVSPEYVIICDSKNNFFSNARFRQVRATSTADHEKFSAFLPTCRFSSGNRVRLDDTRLRQLRPNLHTTPYAEGIRATIGALGTSDVEANT